MTADVGGVAVLPGYRGARLGWEVVGTLQRADLGTASLPSAPVPGVTTSGPPAQLHDYS
ncbi:hypothetical protein SAMN05428965_2401 [Geodermatophilus sp. DSM 45219]|nr:hypothetical protein SAMN05428965_2401 [Geodermatophilus sp. DSM 45219]